MAKNKVAEVNRAFSSTIQKALSTITPSQWQVANHPVKGESVRLYATVPPLKVKDNRGVEHYRLSAFIITEVVAGDGPNEKRVKTREYIYSISSSEDGKALYEFHWHPEKIDRTTLEPVKPKPGDKQPIPYPHTHVRASDKRFDNLNKKHIPSGRVAFEDVIQFLIEDCNMKAKRKDFKAVLQVTRAIFQKKRNW